MKDLYVFSGRNIKYLHYLLAVEYNQDVRNWTSISRKVKPRGRDSDELDSDVYTFYLPNPQALTADGSIIGSNSSLSDTSQTSVTSSPKSIPCSTTDLSAKEVSKLTPAIPPAVAGKISWTPMHSPPVSSAASIHTVKLTAGEVVTFDLRQLENKSQDSVHYTVQDTESARFLACNSAETCRCYPLSYLALNPGVQSGQFFNRIEHRSVYFSQTTAEPTRSTTTKIVTITFIENGR
ncbi:uncharacterized protein An11g06410 [Aspergillus niger]|uniref:Contig An11c0240, genomic contig n=2 Tax=Aspergillus niger TaxID=5061 RepID=A2QWT7_ASPNC|nr:uncharacterized protein An11g06410 [Aspergillus niger]CAK96939.1 unnamed protein product [Aspergillus niger]